VAVRLPTISKEELKEKIENAEEIQIVNVLSPDRYNLGLIQGSLRIPLAELEERMDELDPTVEVVTYCAGTQCPASHQAAEKLAAKGYDVKVYSGGIQEWKEANYPLDKNDEDQMGDILEASRFPEADTASGLSGMPDSRRS